MEESTRRSAHEILEQVIANARDELSRPTLGLIFSGFAGGLSMGLTGLGVALALSYLGDGPAQQFVAFCFYPIGFIVVIIGRAQLFTENTLFPVVLVLDERKHEKGVFSEQLRPKRNVFRTCLRSSSTRTTGKRV